MGAVGAVHVGAVGYPEHSGTVFRIPNGSNMNCTGNPGQGSLGEGAGAVPCCEQATGGGYGARPKEARTTGYYGYTGVPTDVVRANQAMVSGRVGWTGQTTAAGHGVSSGQLGQIVPDGRHTGVDTTRVAGSTIDTVSRTPSFWAGFKPAKLYTGVGQPVWGAGTAAVLQPAYHGQPIQLRPAAPMQYMDNYTHQPLVMDPGAGMAPAPIWNRPVESWVRGPPGQLSGVPCNAIAQGWETGFIPEAWEHGQYLDSPE